MAENELPALVAFDLDYTLWDLWVDTHVSPPLRRRGNELNKIYDRSNRPLSFYDHVPALLTQLRDSKIHVAACSRTSAPTVARQALTQLLMPHPVSPRSAIEYFDTLEIYPGSKLTHFRKLHEKTKIPYAQMVFFDDESRNSEVASLGVTFIHTPNGVDRAVFERGLATWRSARSKTGQAGNVDRVTRSKA
ncbi:uncharacterized protein L969DRAFT_95027 [Mixia osmundae IAM 14324]|uniref:Magnesium-dependent phosphatase-1 n=1 Tax=Mixia osmundae (strain CBS 9802 / IAM 14324 / JCM 22182 / KY 12970) TaxID=764103 RepID=G7E0Z8_MIXOS|nr:uncharacterized protein L969DRAFT_95027 [Mixia osmundae IAM 14324]KEI38857.1 hypothetical protein L969DRAFT_95027 [Mixia osmundae IAM 14324]GAA96508.1 hypothetical protein E5Q_03176 [Mixia osmundae IAM 14324]